MNRILRTLIVTGVTALTVSGCVIAEPNHGARGYGESAHERNIERHGDSRYSPSHDRSARDGRH